VSTLDVGVVTEWLTIPGPGTQLTLFVARPQVPEPLPAVVVLPENLGITEWRQQESARMAAEWGYAVVTMSTYSRIGAKPPQGPFATQDDRRRAAFLAMPDEQVAGDVQAAIAWVREQPQFRSDAVALLGFCSGGGQALYAACTRDKLAECLVVIYGNIILRPEFTEDRRPLDRLPLIRDLDVVLQGHFGALDHEIPPEHVDRLESELGRHGKAGEMFRYEGARHVFSDETHPNYDRAATSLMWQRIARFLHEHLDRDPVG
jgi:carboxymethylenebutenolidase